ncbi:hypothetical protein EDB86DRAFT_2827433 [Lactarius hatsudake]|nr:hypothetical protein EDB86DRAFT_2827433 [Lactarius hatsudake]
MYIVSRVLRDVAGSWRVLGWGGGELACGRVLRAVLGWCWGRWWVAGCCTLCWDGVGAGGSWALRATLRQRGWRWWGRMEVVHVLQGLAHRVGAARWVGDGGVSGQDGGGLGMAMAYNVEAVGMVHVE